MSASGLSEETFFFNSSLDLLAVVGFDGYFKRINPSFTRTLGYSAAEFLADPFLNFVHPDDHSSTRAELEKLKAGAPTLCFENRYQAKDGSYRWLSWTASPQLERGVIYCVAHDVTQQKQTAAALKASEERWQLALGGGKDGIWDWNVQTNEVYFSTRWKTMLGYKEHEIGNRLEEWTKRVHPDDLGWVKQVIQEHFDRKVPFYVSEHRVLSKDGSYKWILDRGQAIWDDAGNVLRMVGSRTDITERRQLEAALQRANQELEQRVAERTAQLAQANRALEESEERNQLAMEVARMFTFEWDVSTDAVKRSAQCGIILGLTEVAIEQDTGANFFQRVHPDDRDRFMAGLQALTPDNSTYKITYRVLCPDGQIVVLEESGRALFDPQGQLTRVIGMTADVTERQRLEAELEQSRVILQQQLAEIEAIYQSAPVGLNFLDPDLRFVRINQRLAEINGLSSEAHLGRTIRQLLPDIADTAEALLRPILETGEPLLDVEIRGETPAQPGVQRVWLESFLPLKDGDRVIGINTVCEEITERKETEQRLRESEERLRLGMQVAGFALAKVDYGSDTVELSPEAAVLFGFPAQPLIVSREQIHATFHPEDQLELERLIEQALDPAGPGWLAHDHRVVWSNGEVRWLTVRKQVFFDRSGDVARPMHSVLVALDITDRKQAEAALRRSEERYRTLFETMEDGFCVIEMLFDDHNFPVDYRFLEINPAFERQTGLQQAIGSTARQLVPDLEDFWVETYGRVALTGEAIRFENGSDVMKRWFEVYAFQIGQPQEHKVAILFKEISERTQLETERQQANAALRENEDRLRMAIASAQLGTWDWNLITGELKWDSGCKAMFGLPPDTESSMELFFAGVHPDDRDRLQEVIQAALNPTSGSSFDTEYRTIGLQDRVERWLRSKGQTYYDAQGTPIRFSGTVLDITEQKQAEAQREKLLRQEQAAREAAEHANRMKDEFLAVLSHELRTPLNPILGWAKLLQSPQVSSEKLQQGLTTIERNAKQQVQLIEDLLDISRIVRGTVTLELATVALSEPIMAAVETVRLAAEAKALELTASLDPAVGEVRGDAGRLQQVVWNLLSNAIKFTPAGGRVTVQLTQVNRQAQIQVSDTGKGIQPRFLPHVFELFRQQDSSTTRSFGGLGLGLAIARQVVEAHGGTITVGSAGEGQGATFTVQLPLMPISIPPVLETPKSHARNFENLRVVVVDDEVDSLELAKVVLEQEGATVQAVTSATAALRVLAQTQFDLLISDIGMPEMDGYTFIRQMRALPRQFNGEIPAIALTAYAGGINQRQILAAGFQAHLAKPIEPQRLLEAIAAILTS